MRLTLFAILVSVVQIFATNAHAQQTRLSLNLKNTSIRSVLEQIENQTDFYFIYDAKAVDVEKTVSIEVENESIPEILDKILEGTNVNYKIDKRQIAISTNSAKNAVQQEITVSGRVTESSGSPLPGVTVIIKGTTKGTITDFDGNYSISDVPSDATLVFSFVGMATQEIPIEGKPSINVVLEEDAIGIEEVVAVGYGTQKKINVIGSIAQIDGEKLESRPITRMALALTGQMSGVTVVQRSGKPGDGGTINIRGVGSFGADATPLVLIDGLPGALGDINMNDVESVSVLKDASSAAIYGSRSANGVILITTKKGKEGEVKVRYDGYLGVQKPTEFPDFVNSWEYAEMYNYASGTNSFSAEDIAKYKSQEDPDNYPNTDFMDEVFSRNGIQTGHDITITSGQKNTKLYTSIGYLNQQGLISENYYKRYNFRMNAVSELTNNLTMVARVSGSYEDRNEPIPNAGVTSNEVEQIVWRALRLPATYLGKDSNGEYGLGFAAAGTPIAWIDSDSYKRRPSSNAGFNMEFKWSPIQDLTLTAIGGYNFELNEMRAYRASQILSSEFEIAESNLDQQKNTSVYKTMQALAEYSKSIKNHDISLLAGYSFEKQDYEDFSGNRKDFPSNDYTVMSMGGVDVQKVYGNDYGWAIQSFFGRMRYNFNDKYLLEATVRRDGSSRFPETKKYATFPSVGAGWRISEEDFFKSAVSWVSNLKLKASWGKLGNQNIGNYPYQSTLASGYNYAFGSGYSNGAAYAVYKDPTIHWETTRTTDIGIETGFFQEKLKFNVAYFDRNTFDILYKPSASVSSILGLSISETNTGEVNNSGWEFEIGHRNTIGDFNYNISGNLTITNNEVVTLGLGNVEQPNGMVGNGSSLFIGYPMQLYYGYRTDGVFLTDEEVADWADESKVSAKPKAGDIRYIDISGPDGVPDGVVNSTYDRTYLGSRIPKYTFSLNLSANYKQFDLSVFLQGVAGVKGMLDGYAGVAFSGGNGNLQRWQMEEQFDPENPIRYPEYPRLAINSGASNFAISDYMVLDASYVRVKNVQLGYSIPSRILKSNHIDKLRIYCSGENLFTFKKYRQGWDPETNTSGTYYPILSVLTMGVSLTF
ncbi:TonB-dependent receptor [Sunxiuqinia elliptica]|nr:TonB-dependent receptor [Sunxiuqinia elliptica]